MSRPRFIPTSWCVLAVLALNPALLAAPILINDNATQPFLSTYEWGLSNPSFASRHTFTKTWLNRTNLWVQDFTAVDTWDNLRGPAWLLNPAQSWLTANPGRKVILSVGMLPGAIVNGNPVPPSSGIGAGVAVSLAQGATGAYNNHWTALANNLVAKGLANDTIIRLGWEFNGNWYVWRAHTAALAIDYRNYWIQIHNTMKAIAPGLKFCWNGNAGWAAYPLSDAYPGDTYVDYIGVDLYDQAYGPNTYPYPASTGNPVTDAANRNTRQNNAWSEISGTNNNGLAWWKAFAVAHNKPLTIPEWGCWDRTTGGSAVVGHGGKDNPGYVQRMADYIQNSDNNVNFHVYFNVSGSDGPHQLTNAGSYITPFPAAAAQFRQCFGLTSTTSADIGGPTSSTTHGTTTRSGTTWTLTSGGAGIGGGTDQFQFAYRKLPGDKTLIARVTGVTNTSAGAKAGVMARANFYGYSRGASVLVRADGTVDLVTRTQDGGTATLASVATGVTPSTTTPVWVRLVKTGNSFAGSYATGTATPTTWNPVGGAVSVTFPTSWQGGLAATSGLAGTMATATFTNVSPLLPTPMNSGDIGSPSVAGFSSYAGSVATLVGEGSNLSGTSDQFQFAYRQSTGNQTLVTRVTGLTNTAGGTCTGLMIRGGTTANAAYVMVCTKPTGGLEFRFRTAPGASTNYSSGNAGVTPSAATPIWLKLTRSTGGWYNGYWATGTSTPSTWTFLGSTNVTSANLGDTCQSGIFVHSHVVGTAATATMDNISP